MYVLYVILFIFASTAKVISKHRPINVVSLPGIEPGNMRFKDNHQAHYSNETNCDRICDYAKQTVYRAWCRAHIVHIIGVDLYLPVLRPRKSTVLQESHIMNAHGILWSTPPVQISDGRHLKPRYLVWSSLFLLSGAWRWFGDGSSWESLRLGSLFDSN